MVGAYVQAWVWVDIDDDQQLNEDQIRELAVEQWHKPGECEIDSDAVVSISEGLA